MHRRTRSAARSGLVVAGLVLLAGAAAPSPVASADDAARYDAVLLAESWYRGGADGRPGVEACGIPVVGCAPLPPVTVPSQYPPGTLHVGVAASAEDSRTYLTLVSSGVPFGQDVVGGTLTLPVLTDAESGTLAPETASLRACLVNSKVQPGVEGGIGGAPAADCAMSSPAIFTPAQGSAGPFFKVDLAPFAARFSLAEVSLALVPGEEPGTAWHVAFARSDSEVEGARPITAEVRTAAGSDVISEPALPADAGQGDPPPLSSGDPGLTPVQPDVVAPPAPGLGVAPVVVAPSASPLPRVVAQPAAALSSSGLPFVVLLLPLVLTGVATWVSRAFTREMLRAQV